MVRLWLLNTTAAPSLVALQTNPLILSQMIGIYIHVPFCKKRCIYCDFYSTTYGKRERVAFVQALVAEMKLRRTTETVRTIYFGGGTPSQLDREELTTIFKTLREHYNIAHDVEITFEANPDDISPEFAKLLSEVGVNRVSLGVQSFDNEMLQKLNRRHNAQQAQEAISTLRNAGIQNISIDLIYGLPGQSLEDWEKELSTALKQGAQHFSAYSLTYESGTPLYRMRTRGEVKECDEEISLSMFQILIEKTRAAGYEHYEISNFALPGFRSRHNTSYWQGIPYLGFGPAAHSFDGNRSRRYNLPTLKQYNASENGDVPHNTEQLSDEEHFNERIMTRLRTKEGLLLDTLSTKEKNYLLRMAEPHLQNQVLELTQDGELRFTSQGIFVSDGILADLMWVE